MDRNGPGRRLFNDMEQFLTEKNIGYKKDEMEEKVRMFIPTRSERSSMEGFTLFISDFMVQIMIFDVVRDVEKNEKNLYLLNDMNMKHLLMRFIINNENSVLGVHEIFNDDNNSLDAKWLVDYLSGSMNDIDDVYDNFMKVRYS